MKKTVIRSIAVAIDNSPYGRASLEAAAGIAARLSAELIGIFIEDINLIRMAGLPFVEEVRFYSSTTGRIDPDKLEGTLRKQAAEARALLERTAGQLTVRHSFRVSRGNVPEEVMGAAPEADLLVLGRQGRSDVCGRRLGSTARAALCKGRMTLLLMRTGMTLAEAPLLVLYDGSEGSKRALGTALAIAGSGSRLHIVAVSPEGEAGNRLFDEVAAIIGSSGLEVDYHRLPPGDGRKMAERIRTIGKGMLVLSDRMGLDRETLCDLVDAIDWPVLIVRE